MHRAITENTLFCGGKSSPNSKSVVSGARIVANANVVVGEMAL
jgi:hypothetical protein